MTYSRLAAATLAVLSVACAVGAAPVFCRRAGALRSKADALQIRGDVPAAISFDVYRQLRPLNAQRIALFQSAGEVKHLPDGLAVCEVADDGVDDPSAVLVALPARQERVVGERGQRAGRGLTLARRAAASVSPIGATNSGMRCRGPLLATRVCTRNVQHNFRAAAQLVKTVLLPNGKGRGSGTVHIDRAARCELVIGDAASHRVSDRKWLSLNRTRRAHRNTARNIGDSNDRFLPVIGRARRSGRRTHPRTGRRTRPRQRAALRPARVRVDRSGGSRRE